jgi:serine/threonine protein kinase
VSSLTEQTNISPEVVLREIVLQERHVLILKAIELGSYQLCSSIVSRIKKIEAGEVVAKNIRVSKREVPPLEGDSSGVLLPVKEMKRDSSARFVRSPSTKGFSVPLMKEIKREESSAIKKKHSMYRKMESAESEKATMIARVAGLPHFNDKLHWFKQSMASLIENGRSEAVTDFRKTVSLFLSLVLPVDSSGNYRNDAQADSAKATWLEFLQNKRVAHVDMVNHLFEKTSSGGLGFGSSMLAVRRLCDTRDAATKVAIQSASVEIMLAIWKYALFCGRYELDSGLPAYHSSTTVVAFANDCYLFYTYERVFENYCLLEVIGDEETPCLDKDGFVDCMCDLNHELPDMVNMSTEDMELSFVQCAPCGYCDWTTFFQFCKWKIGEYRRVAIKFMKKRAQYEIESQTRRKLNQSVVRASATVLGSRKASIASNSRSSGKSMLINLSVEFSLKHFLPVLDDFPLKPEEYLDTVSSSGSYDEIKYRKLEILKEQTALLRIDTVPSLSEYKYAIAMPVATTTLAQLFSQSVHQCRGHGNKCFKISDIKFLAKGLAVALSKLHAAKIIHGDIKPQNVGFIGNELLLFDFDSAGTEENFAGFKYSSAYLPPEMFCCLSSEPDCAKCFPYSQMKPSARFYFDSKLKKFFGVKAFDMRNRRGDEDSDAAVIRSLGKLQESYGLLQLREGFDMWAFGMVLYSLCTGRNTFFDISQEDNGNLPPDRYRLAYELGDMKSETFRTLDRSIGALVCDLDAQDLLRKILVPANERLDSIHSVLNHPFVASSSIRSLSPKQEMIMIQFKCNILAAIRHKRPIHAALYQNISFSTEFLLEHIHSARDLDHSGRAVIDLLISKLSSHTAVAPAASSSVGLFYNIQVISEDCLFMLIDTSMHFDENGKYLADASMHRYSWAKLLRMSNPVAVHVARRIVAKYERFVDRLVHLADENGRLFDARTHPSVSDACREIVSKATYLFQIYDVNPDPPLASSESLTFFAKDFSVDSQLSSYVTLQFLRSKQQFLSEVFTRRSFAADSKYIVPIRRSFCSDNGSADDTRFFSEASKYIERNGAGAAYKYCIVMEAVDVTLDTKLSSEEVAGKDWNVITAIAKSLSGCVHHLHQMNIVCGDLRPRNIALDDENNARIIHLWSCIPLSASLVTAVGATEGTVCPFSGYNSASAYLPPECFFKRDVNGGFEIIPRSFLKHEETGAPLSTKDRDYDLVPACITQDLWALGAVFYFLFTGTSLFQASSFDNAITNTSDLMDVYFWTDEIKARKLMNIRNGNYRELVRRLVHKVPSERMFMETVLACLDYPRSLSNALPEFDVFLSYRVSTDFDMALKFYNTLTSIGIRVWWDKKCIPLGSNWEREFCDGLYNSCFCICFISEACLNHPSSAFCMHDSPYPDGQVNDHSEKIRERLCDNLLLEWTLATELSERHVIEGIIPIFIGTNAKGRDLFPSLCPSQQMVDKLDQHFDRLKLEKLSKIRSIRDVMGAMYAHQGVHLKGLSKDSHGKPPVPGQNNFDEVITSIAYDIQKVRLMRAKTIALVVDNRAEELQYMSKLEIDLHDAKVENIKLRTEMNLLKGQLATLQSLSKTTDDELDKRLVLPTKVKQSSTDLSPRSATSSKVGAL